MAAKTSAEYWKDRSDAISAAQHEKAYKYSKDQLKREYDRAAASIQRDIDVFYNRFAVNNEISLAEARKLLDSNELKEFKMSVEEFTELAKNNPDGQWTQKLNNASFKVRISRLQALQIQIEAAIQALNVNQNEGMTDLLSDTYTDTYYRNVFMIQQGIGIGVSFAKANTDLVEKVIKTPWLGENYSQRIWKDNTKLVQLLQTEITQAIIRGDGSRETARVIADRMGVGYRNAERLVRTEASHIQNEAAFDSYRESGIVDKYEYLATLDRRTSKICGEMDNHIFTLAEKEVGVNFPPLHANCRSTTTPYFEDEEDVGERFARDAKGKAYTVPASMSYSDWYESHVE